MPGWRRRGRRARRSFSPEFKARTVETGPRERQSILEVARDLDLTESALRDWVRQADIDDGRREGFYNTRRRHSALGNRSPARYEAEHSDDEPSAA